LNRKKRSTPVQPAKPQSTDPMDVGLLQQIVKLMAANDLNTVDIRDGDKRVILKRGQAGVVYASAPPVPALRMESSSKSSGESAPTDTDTSLVPIKSPMVGTFYSKPSPDAKPFVAVGTVVDEDSDVCVIEAMKVFNNIKAECRGTVSKILVNDGQTVEFGTVLFLVKPV
jgi:acetyl-CoA carboxylase biotin carboxyl carrier protein